MATSKTKFNEDFFRSDKEDKKDDIHERDLPDLNKGDVKNWDSDNWKNSNKSDDSAADGKGEITDRIGPMRKPDSDEA